MRTRRVECPKCNRVSVAYDGESEMACNCHLYCEDGDKPSDCSITKDSFSGDLSWPLGMHTGDPPGIKADNPMRRYFYCSVHNNFIMTPPVVFPVDWSRAVPKKLRFNRAV